MTLASCVAWYQSLHHIICLPGASLLSFMGTDLSLIWLHSQVPKMLECRDGVDGLFAAAVCSCALGTNVRRLVSHALRNELVQGFGFCRA